MTRLATVVRVLIASPGDANDARDVVETVIDEWNRAHAATQGVRLDAVRWERDALPEFGRPPQVALNEELVQDSDIGIAMFRSRLGTPTVDAQSGTVEEIELLVKLGRPVMVYFLHDMSPEPGEQARLEEYRSSLAPKCLYWSVADLASLKVEVGVHLARAIRTVARSKTYALSDQDVEILKHISRGYGDQSAWEAASLLGMEIATATFHIHRLVELGLVESHTALFEETSYTATQQGLAELHQRGLLA